MTVTYVVTQTGSVLNATRTMEKRGQAVTEAVFTNEFEKPNYIVTFDGNGAWRPFESQTVREGLMASETNSEARCEATASSSAGT